MTAEYRFDLDSEELFDLETAGQRLARWRGGKPVHKNGVARWCRTPSNTGILLPSLMVGGRRLTSEGALRWWIAASSAASLPHNRPAPIAGDGMTPADRAVLERAGIVDRAEGTR